MKGVVLVILLSWCAAALVYSALMAVAAAHAGHDVTCAFWCGSAAVNVWAVGANVRMLLDLRRSRS